MILRLNSGPKKIQCFYTLVLFFEICTLDKMIERVENIYVVSQFGMFALASFTIFTRVTCRYIITKQHIINAFYHVSVSDTQHQKKEWR